MNSNDIIKKVYAAIVRKAKKDIAAGESAQIAVDVGNDVITVGQTWTSAIGDDGKISDTEEQNMNNVFGSVVDKRIPNTSGATVTFLYEGFTIFGIGFKGLKFYLNKWFGLDLD